MTLNPRTIVFKCVMGLGNRLNNLINMFVLHEHYPNAQIYLLWPINNHCGASVTDLFDLSGFSWIKITDSPPVTPGEFFATTTSTTSSPWDTVSHWTIRPAIVSHAVWPFKFISHSTMTRIFLSLPLKSEPQKAIQSLISLGGEQRSIIHFRKGDLLKILINTEATTSDIETRINSKLEGVPKDWLIQSYAQDVPKRPKDATIQALAELIYYSKHCDLRGYCPYSTFSSWLFILSPNYTPTLPCFTTGVVDLILIEKKDT